MAMSLASLIALEYLMTYNVEYTRLVRVDTIISCNLSPSYFYTSLKSAGDSKPFLL